MASFVVVLLVLALGIQIANWMLARKIRRLRADVDLVHEEIAQAFARHAELLATRESLTQQLGQSPK